MSSQYVAAASQNRTCPVVSGVDPALTAAVRVTTLPETMDVTGAPAEVTVRVVDVIACAAPTVSASGVVSIRVPEVPVIVTVASPVAAALLAVSVRVLEPLVGFGENDAVTPLGRPDAARLTLPVNPYWGTT
jgi:hypothetical protein